MTNGGAGVVIDCVEMDREMTDLEFVITGLETSGWFYECVSDGKVSCKEGRQYPSYSGLCFAL
ncbi:hypothetical protein JCM9140_810 [Halalkalibacter wakoensis JCM 9140]|uniref:Uncharacterized protein n=1 Tax=Halalkalibacter wakoensis JCM 9140 TaxID=1236970 RepID=W4PYE0_9BACI|nr:hypothetical protein JCM9140_810 [Halalkalibacter wakoensis JCM 9140]